MFLQAQQNVHEDNYEDENEKVGSIEVYDPKKTVSPVRQALPQKAVKPLKKAVKKSFHAALPPHLLENQQLLKAAWILH